MNTRTWAMLATLVWAGTAWAEGSAPEVPLGLWKTEADSQGLVLNVRTRPCGRALCGRVERAKNRRGFDTPSTMVGQKILWELRPQPDGSFLGRMVDSQGTWFAQTRVEQRGGKLYLRACHDSGCEDRVWTRLR